MNSEVRTRYAPSPTGYMHIGNLRTALYEYLIAKKHEGKFILRIEDTDQERFVEGSTEVIYKTLYMAGLKHDEGPDIGGEYGSYIQSERKPIYLQYAKELIKLGGAYYCFCTKERLADLKASQETKSEFHRYDRCCLGLSQEEINKNLQLGLPFVIRQKMPDTGSTSFDDVVYGTITVDNKELEDQILIKSDGLPTYNFANVVDDHLMKITHVVRGNEYLSSAPKYNLLYKAFGWEIPIYVHVPLIVKANGQKMSKRNGDPSFEDLIGMGYLIDAIVNYVVLLGWSPGGTQEIFSLKELEKCFNISGISKSPAVFDINKLNWMNGEYIRKMSLEAFHEKAMQYYKGVITNPEIDLKKISKILQARVDVLTAIPSMVDFIEKMPEFSNDLYIHKKMKTTTENSLESLKASFDILQSLPESEWNELTIHNTIQELVLKMGIKNGQMFWPIRTALTGKEVTPGGAIEIADILGKIETLKRIAAGIKKLEENK